MDLSAINAQLCAAKEILQDKGYYFPEAKLYIEPGAITATVTGITVNDRYAWESRKTAYATGCTTPEDTLDLLLTKAAELPNMHDERRSQLAAKAASLAEEMKELGVEVEFVNPIVQAAQKLAANALPAPAIAAE
ncbi:hypothetical protein [Rhodobacter lacus]|uniref:Uncharacterized protein n=1 Tax=Rhodobacter lacus TaxID=1641972 RepID=A0ABW5ABJ2_9RHOB